MDNIVRANARKTGPVVDGVRRAPQPTQQKPSKQPNFKRWIIGIIVANIILLAGLFAWGAWVHRDLRVNSDRYQAVFLDDGKVFFGKLNDVTGDYVMLERAYYTQQPAVSTDGETNLQPANGVNLIKVGEEVYGPENNLVIRSDQILFWQNLTPDSQVVKAIQNQED